MAVTDTSIRLRGVREAGMRAKRTVRKGRETTDLKSQIDLSSDHHLLFLFSKPQLPQLYSEFLSSSWRGAMRTNDKAGKDRAGQEARRQAQGCAGCMGALLLPPRGEIWARQEASQQSPGSCAAQAESSPATKRLAEKGVCGSARLSIWLMFTCVSYWRASLFSPHLVCLPKQAAH